MSLGRQRGLCTAQLGNSIVEPGCGVPHAVGFMPLIRGGKKLTRRQRQLKPHFFVERSECPDKDEDLQRWYLGHPGRDDRIYGIYKETTVASRSVTALPDDCILPVSVS